MIIKKKIVGLGSIFGVALVVSSIVISESTVLKSYRSFEKSVINNNLSHLDKAVDQQLVSVKAITEDWSKWDDAYQFMADKNTKFYNLNLNNDTTFEAANLNVIGFYDLSGKQFVVKWHKTNRSETELSEALIDSLNTGGYLVSDETDVSFSKSGVIKISDFSLMISASSILPNNKQGKVRGTLVMGRVISEKEIALLSDMTGYKISISNPGVILDPQTGFSIQDNQIITKYIKKDTSGLDSLTLYVTFPRDIYKQGESTALTYTLLSAANTAIVVVAFLIFFQYLIIKPIISIAEDVGEVSKNPTLTGRISESGTDEVGMMAKNINLMLSALQASREQELSRSREVEDSRNAIANVLEDERNLEEELRSEKERANLVISSMGEGLLVIDDKFKIVLINPAAQKLLEVDESIIGKDWSTVVSTVKDSRVVTLKERSFRRVIETGKIIATDLDSDHYYITKSGKRFPIVSVTAPLVRDGKVIGAVKVFRDATNEKMSKKIVEAKLSTSIKAIPFGFVILDIDHRVLMQNDAFSNIMSTSDLSKALSEMKLSFKDICADCKKTRKSFEVIEVEYRNKFLNIYSTPVVESDSCIGTVVLVQDVTDRKLLDRSKDEFLSVASHELRTPLTAIMGNSSLIRDHYTAELKDQKLKEMVDDIHTASKRLIGIVNDFLSVSRLEQGKISFVKEEFNLNECVKQIAVEFNDQVVGKGLYLKVIDDKKRIMVKADKVKTIEILTNLLGNSLKYTQKGGIEIKVGIEGQNACVWVVDTGIGIAEAKKNLLFKKFQQAGEDLFTRDPQKSTGLGLYISRLMAEAMGGEIILEKSVLSKGSTFKFLLPVATKKQ